MVGSRKRAPSSYVSVGPPSKNGSLPQAAKNIPDWTLLIEAVVGLVRSCINHSMAQGIVSYIHPTIIDLRHSYRDKNTSNSS
jgi:hypothetical protein